ncbi:T5SS/PEP-CTERM-associated repeat-containing protein [Rubritalea squalenifaciens DSM 18772]|uniref:T5SS/PEP-CTERM-associated repeat-containing protein n=1 Tax=Rubritalea squalenifaciens DSM 18772 TaxID=1123071 RepID=A0A1M6GYQ2_9BACT|nr:T5SS/PEP-CTERM-associated repeat-containing protein [Rubritalea squalenifaciens DSM 18772]
MLTLTSPISAQAATAIWSGGGGTNNTWSLPFNWVNNQRPGPNDTASFLFHSSSTQVFLPIDIAKLEMGARGPAQVLSIGQSSPGNVTVSGQSLLGNEKDGTTRVYLNNDSEFTSGSIILGGPGTGEMEVKGGSSLSTGSYLTLGDDSSGIGTLLVDGADSSLSTTSVINLGLDGEGTLTFSNNATGSVGTDLRVGHNSGSTGTLNLGAGTGIAVLDDLLFGAGTGWINQSAGATLNVTDEVYMGHVSTGHGTWQVNASPATVGDNLFVGFNGGGTLTVTGSGSSLSVANKLEVARNPGSTGTLTLSNGTLNAANFAIAGSSAAGGGNGSFTQSSGTTTITNGTVVHQNGSFDLDGGVFNTTDFTSSGIYDQSGGSFSANGISTLTGHSNFDLRDGSFTTKSLSATGNMAQSGGTFTVSTASSFGGATVFGLGNGNFTTNSLTSSGRIDQQGGTLTTTTTSTFNSGADFDLTSGNFETNSLNNSGTFTQSGGTVKVGTTATVDNGGKLALNGGTFTATTGVIAANSARITIDGGSLTTPSLSTSAGGGSLVFNDGSIHLTGGNWDYENTAPWLLESADSTGNAIMEYTGSTIDHSSQSMTIGETGNGKLVLNQSTIFRTGDLYLGSGDGGYGVIEIGGRLGTTTTPRLLSDNITLGDESSARGTGILDIQYFDHGNSYYDGAFIGVGDADFLSDRDSRKNWMILSNSTNDGGVLTLQGGADLDLDSSRTRLFVGYYEGEYGTISMGDGSTLTASETIYIGDQGHGTLTMEGNAELALRTSIGHMYLANSSGSTGTWTGANGSLRNLYVGFNGDGYLSMAAGDTLDIDLLRVSYFSGSSGVFAMQDASLDAGPIRVGGSNGAFSATNSQITGSNLLIGLNGQGTVNCTHSNVMLTEEVTLGHSGSTSAGDFGHMNIVGGSFQTGSDLTVGHLSNGKANLLDGAQVSIAGDLIVGNNLASDESGVLNLTSSSSQNPSSLDITGNARLGDHGSWITDLKSVVRIGNGDTSTITFGGYNLVSDTSGEGSFLTLAGDGEPVSTDFNGQLLAGWNAGETGNIILDGSGTVLTTRLGARLGENGNANVSLDNGAQWITHEYIDFADQTGTVAMTLQNGAKLSGGKSMFVGDGSGQATIDLFSGSSIDMGFLVLGDDESVGRINVDASTLGVTGMDVGDGSATQDGEGFVTLTNGSALDCPGSISVGDYGIGSLTLDNSTWVTENGDIARLYIGNDDTASGTMTVRNGSTVAIERVWVGEQGTATMIIDGAATTFTHYDNFSQLRIALEEGGSGSVTVQNGATHLFQELNTNNVRIGERGIGHYTVTGAGSTSQFAGDVEVGSTATAAGSSLKVRQGAHFSTAGLLEVGNGCTMLAEDADTSVHIGGNFDLNNAGLNTATLQNQATMSIAGTLQIGNDDTFNLLTGATLEVAAISGNLTNTSGTFSPGNSPAHTTITGDYTQLAAGTLEIELAGTTQGSEYDFLDISGNASLAGTIDVTYLDDYSPSGGESFTILSANTLTDNGYTINLPALPNSWLEWEVTETATSITLTIDFTDDLDGFRARYGLNPDGSDDFLDWSNNGIANILYFAFGLGDPNNASIDRSRLPSGEQDADSFVFTYLEPTNSASGVTITPVVSANLDQWQTPTELGELPTNTTTEDLGDGYQRHTLIFPLQSTPRFFTIKIEVTRK